ncbi:hypothetical protein RS3R6_03110 [Pseudomonas atacamensis]|nr:hypothetical protein RS3R6_03110 [Pseudomonas atacamensis]
MVGNPLRILVADKRFEQRVIVEKCLGLMGYYKVCPAGCFEEMITLTHINSPLVDRFDLLIVNANLVVSAGVDVFDFCFHNSRVKNVLVYEAALEAGTSTTYKKKFNWKLRLIPGVGAEALEDFLSLIDSNFRQKKKQNSKARSVAF